jgi:hypothetical protein
MNQSVVILGPRFCRDDVGHPIQQGGIPRGGQSDCLREHGGAARRHAVQCLVPPDVGRYAEARNPRSGALHLQHLFLQRHVGDEIRGALFGRQIRIQVWRVARLLSE